MKSSNTGPVRTILHSRLIAASAPLLLVLTLLGASASVQASQRFAARLIGIEETSPNVSSGNGYGSVVLSDDQTTITVNLGFSGLGSNARMALIHNGPLGSDGPAILELQGVPDITDGTVAEQTFPITPDQVTALKNANLYFNLYSINFPGGEIRGQILSPFCVTGSPVEVQATGGTVGPTGYPSLLSAFGAIQSRLHQQAIDIQICANTTETASLVLNASGGGGSPFYSRLNIFPVGGAWTISGAIAVGSPLLDLNGADNVTVDGVNTGGNSLTISNTTAAGTAETSTVRFINDASNNILQGVTIRGSGNSNNVGTVLFSTTTGANGNDHNLINLCNIGPAGANFPFMGILSSGTTTTAAQNNSDNQVTNNNIFDFFATGSPSNIPRGVLLAGGSTVWTISGNSFYQTAARAFTTAIVPRAISIENLSGNNFTVSNNFIGGSAPNAGGAAWTQTGAVAHGFIGIRINVGTITPTNVQGNTIQNISITNASTSAMGAGISIPTGSVNVTGNTIGSQSGTGSIIQSNSSSGIFNGILSQPTAVGDLNVSNNTIGGITMAGAGAQSFRGVRIEIGIATGITISNNTIGSATTANSIQTNSSSAAAALGISVTNQNAKSVITGNTVANFQLTSAGASGFRGIETTGSIAGHIMSNNTIRDVTSASTQFSLNVSPALVAIFANGSTSGRTISGNRIFNLTSTATGATAVNVIGILTGSSNNGGTMNGNLIYDLSAAADGATIRGIYLSNAAAPTPWTLTNNMIRLGTGISTSLNPIILGIDESTGVGATENIWSNSIFIGGTQGAATVNTAAIFRTGQGSVDIRNNILWNNRSSTGAPGASAGRHYCIQIFVGNAPLTTNFNNLFADGNGGAVGFLNSDWITLADWQTASAGFDTKSFSANPSFVDATNATPDLHLTPANPESRGGQTIAAIATDFDAQTRPQPAATNPDIGADEGDFTLSQDFLPPVISYPLLPIHAGGTSVTLTGFATITDNSGAVAGGFFTPRLYYKKSTDANGLVGNTNADDGWKFVVASNSTSPYDFTIDYTIIFGGSVSNGDVIQYFVVAQDVASNVGINSGTFLTPPAGVQLTAAAFPLGGTINSFTITSGISGAKTVCAGGCDYTGLTPAGGLFAAINGSVVTGNLTVMVTGDLTLEDGANALDQWTEDGAGGFTLTIQPSGARTIRGSNNTALISLNGADRVTFNGLNNGADSLLIRNTSGDSGAVIELINDASSNNIMNSTIEGGNTELGTALIFIGSGTGTGNDNNTISGNIIRDRTDVAGVPGNLVNSNNGSSTALNSGNTLSGNQLLNFAANGFVSLSNGTSDNWTVINNDISQNATRATSVIGIAMSGMGGTNLVSGNSIHGFISSDASTMRGLQISNSTNLTVSANRVYDFQTTAGATGLIAGLDLFGSSVASKTVMVNNMVALAPTIGSAQEIVGLQVAGVFNSVLTADNNSFYVGGTASGAESSWAMRRGPLTSVNFTARNNIAFNNRAGGTGSNFASGDQSPAPGTFVSDFNFFAGTGSATPADFMDYGTAATGTPVSFPAWQPGPAARDANSSAGLAASFVVTDVFVNVANGDLHLRPTAGVGILRAGTPLGATDYDNDPRPVANPDIGADELVKAVNAVFPAGTFYNVSASPSDSLGGNTTVTGQLWLNGILNTGASALTISCTASVMGASATNYVNGNLTMSFCGVGSKTFDVGTANGYAPMSANATAGTFPSNFTVKAVQGPDPAVNPNTSIQRYWVLSGSDITVDLTFQYLAGDVMGNEANYRVIREIGGTVVAFPNSVINVGLHTASLAGVSSFSNWTVGEVNGPTSAPAAISGIVTTSDGQPLGGVSVNLGDGLSGARTITDANGQYRFDNVETNDFYIVTPGRANYAFSPASRSFMLLANTTDAVFTATATLQSENPLNGGDFFVRQQYLDFLGREPDRAGWLYWTKQLSDCGQEQNCIRLKRIEISATFFGSEEFQRSGNYIYRLYRAGLGRQLTYAEFTEDHQKVIGGAGLELLRTQFADTFVERSEFMAKYQNAMLAETFVDALLQTTLAEAQVDLSSKREALITTYHSGDDMNRSRSAVLRTVAEDSEFQSAVYNPSFVLMEYFGYLQRDLDQEGFDFWVNVLSKREQGNYRGMVCSFLTAAEYQKRFSAIVTHSNRECGP